MSYKINTSEFEGLLDELEENLRESITLLVGSTGAPEDNPELCHHFSCEQSKLFRNEIRKAIVGFVQFSPFLPGNK